MCLVRSLEMNFSQITQTEPFPGFFFLIASLLEPMEDIDALLWFESVRWNVGLSMSR